MSTSDIQSILKQVEEQLAKAGELPTVVEQAVGQLLNVVEALSSDKKALVDEVEQLRKQLEQKKKDKTTGKGDGPKQNTEHSSEKQRRKRRKPRSKRAFDRRSFKDLTIHKTVECPVDPATLPPDAVRVEDEEVIVQDIEIKPRNIRFGRHVYYSAAEKKS